MMQIRFILFAFLQISRKKIISHKRTMCLLLLLLFLTQYLRTKNKVNTNTMMKHRRLLWEEFHDFNIQSRIEIEKGTGCEMPKTDPYAAEIMALTPHSPKITCTLAVKDWVSCNGSHCYVIKEILENMPTVECHYSDIVYVSDDEYFVETPVILKGRERYTLKQSDHVKVYCIKDNRFPFSIWSPKWYGIKAGFRQIRVSVPPGREDSPNVLVVGFDSVSHNQFLRRLPLAYHFLTRKLGATVLNSYNIVGDGTNAALFPMLTGKTELELPDTRKETGNNAKVDPGDFLFFKLREKGYHTAYFEDLPEMGTFQQRFNGFKYQPADHYLRAFFIEANKMAPDCLYCIGSTPRYVLMMNLTHQFAMIEGKRFGFTLISDITHDGDYLQTADDEMVHFLKTIKADGILENTLLIVMADHGSRYERMRMTYQGKIEERLPFMAIVLPESLKRARPSAENSLKANVDVLTTPFDIHTTILDVVGLQHLSNDYKVRGSNLPRSMSLLEAIPASRSCAEADVMPHWCACLKWENVSRSDPAYERAAKELAKYINGLAAQNAKCSQRELNSIEWVMRQSLTRQLLDYANIGTIVTSAVENYQAQIVMSPKRAVYEATMTFVRRANRFLLSENDISRVSAYGDEPNCVMNTHPHLAKFCYCK